MRLRFSLRTMLLATAVVAAVCFWIILPTVNADRFVRAVDAGDYKVADNCFHDSEDRFLAAWDSIFWSLKSEAQLEPLTLRNLLHGERHVSLHFEHTGPDGISTASIIATRTGLASPRINFVTLGAVTRQRMRRIVK